jgi:phage repressor protein C with HTH and peptisase S24 domain
MDNKEIYEDMKDYFKVSSLEDVALKLGYSKTTASTWRTRGITQAAINKYEIIKSKNFTEKDEISQITVNLYKDVYASAGYGTNNSEIRPSKMTFDKEFLREIFNITNFNNLDIIRVIGDSMLPYIKDGEYIFVQKDTPVKNGDTIIANIDGELYVKRYYKIPFEKWIKLESDNPDYPCINIDSEDKLNSFQILGIVKSKIKLY